MDVSAFYADKGLASKLASYLGGKDVEERLAKGAADLAANECLIPVLGTQGAGKSSFLNAVLFGDIVLPVDADETTCIPTAVRYGANVKPAACVILADGSRKTVPCSEKGLSDYVHQEKNPGNKKGVACIEITVKNDLLKDGIVFVDLPGVGSITAANQKTTTDYLKKCTAAIFMLRTVPPITQSESVFIQGALPLMGRVFWVQNQWTDESKDEVTEGKEHNFSVLKKIASACRLPETVIAMPDVVCVKRALDGRVKDDAKMIKTSGIEAFRDQVVAFAKNWRRDVLSARTAQAVELLGTAAAAAEQKAERLSGDAEVERAKIRAAKKKAEAVLDANAKLVREAREFIADREASMRQLIATECRKAAENLRNGVRESIDGGLTGGDQLNQAFNDYVQREHEELFHTLQPEFLSVGTQVQEMLTGLQDVSVRQQPLSAGKGGRKFSDKTKAHEFYGSGGSLVGGVIGAKLGIAAGSATTAFVSAKAGALLGSAAGPVGTAIGAVAGLAVGAICMLFGSFCGRKARELQLEKQKEQARAELFHAVEEFVTDERKGYESAYASFAEDLECLVKDWMRTQKDETDAHFRAAAVELARPVDEKKAAAEAAAADAVLFHKVQKELGKLK